MIVDCHAHYTTAPGALWAYRAQQMTSLNRPKPANIRVSEEELHLSLRGQLAQMDARGIDALMFSPQASAMGHDIGDALVSRYWTEANNDLVHRVCQLYPHKFIPVCQLPQSPGVSVDDCVCELTRCVEELGFVGCNINPDVSGGQLPYTPSLGSSFWYPLWEAMIELDVPAMVHASSTRVPALHANGSHYVMQDYAAVVDLCLSDVFERYPTLHLIIPHGGGAIPFQFNRQRALHLFEGHPRPFEEVVRNLYFDTSVYDADSLAMLVKKIGADRVLFGSEMFGTAREVDPATGKQFDEIIPIIRQLEAVEESQLAEIFYDNALRIFPRAAAALSTHGSVSA